MAASAVGRIRSALFNFLLIFIVSYFCHIQFIVAEDKGNSEGTDSRSYERNLWSDDFVIWWNYARIPLFTFVFASFSMTWFFVLRNERMQKPKEKSEDANGKANGDKKIKSVSIFYGSQTGTAKGFANKLKGELETLNFESSVTSMDEYDPEDNLVDDIDASKLFVFIVSTYTNGQPAESAQWFCKYIAESSDDCRVQKAMLIGLRYAVFGLGNSLYEDYFNTVAQRLDKSLQKLSAVKFYPTGLGDANVPQSKNGGLEEDFDSWKDALKIMLTLQSEEEKSSSCCQNKEKCCSENNEEKCCSENSEKKCCSENGEEKCCQNEVTNNLIESSSDEDIEDDEEDMVDVEDLGKISAKLTEAKNKVNVQEAGVRARRRKGKIASEEKDKKQGEVKEMVTPLIRKNLEKQGYKVLGSHSGVKICRWTKAMLRGRGGCYKHTFYGINSHQCMETTPSLACANKCVFCWRHHTNPVGTEWNWKMDDPDMIVDAALQNHYNMIKQFRGVPGVLPERFKEGMNVQHCALSLVGEPIMYPRINEMIDLLHSKSISSFLVTNAQFPDAIRNLSPCTQLYVSVDASDKDGLKKIDRPLFRDFWQRFVDSLKALDAKGQRTVYRLTLVKSFNTDDVKGYADLVNLGNPGFIEVKGVTYCGESKASSLTMQNIPWHDEVINFVRALEERLPEYELASEHEHSNCVLLAHKKLLRGSHCVAAMFKIGFFDAV
eukprot:gene13969-15426_t